MKKPMRPNCPCGGVFEERYGPFGVFFGCNRWPKCDHILTFVAPLNEWQITDTELRKLRIQAHAKIDPIWRKKLASRKRVYEAMSKIMDVTPLLCHIQYFDKDTCRRLLRHISRGDLHARLQLDDAHSAFNKLHPRETLT